jgi:hypothetical protein
MPLDKNGIDLKKYKTEHKIFIETGSADGDGIQSALNAGFEQIISIELNPSLHEKCKDRFKNHLNVKLLCGSSEILLPQVLNNLNESFILWLDAHWSGGEYIGEMMHNYLPKELNSITNLVNKFKDSPILIDDMNFYINDKSFCNNIENLLKQIKPDGNIKYEESCDQEAKSLFLVVL